MFLLLIPTGNKDYSTIFRFLQYQKAEIEKLLVCFKWYFRLVFNRYLRNYAGALLGCNEFSHDLGERREIGFGDYLYKVRVKNQKRMRNF